MGLAKEVLMNDDFEALKKQIRDLSGIINEFKSEAVQLRVVELLFDRMGTVKFKGIEKDNDEKANKHQKGKLKSGTNEKGKKGAVKRGSMSARPGPGAIIKHLIGEGFFKKPKSVKEIVDYCKSKNGYNYKTPELNVGLLRALRSNTLQRKKNEKNQFEYYE
jgi:hypothetical protein